eukprot:TRINITY_DN2119_c0_g1_i3.p1 TRINITY_DN2119_c0_g1~~TRINITY_DN2119_c0_g1_i3.p1  ORF type:complete len:136 (-),score=44.59 TRINITY_DN2119_c0_g1_i3:370-777(-)
MYQDFFNNRNDFHLKRKAFVMKLNYDDLLKQKNQFEISSQSSLENISLLQLQHTHIGGGTISPPSSPLPHQIFTTTTPPPPTPTPTPTTTAPPPPPPIIYTSNTQQQPLYNVYPPTQINIIHQPTMYSPNTVTSP